MSTNYPAYTYDAKKLADREIRLLKFNPCHKNKVALQDCVHLEDLEVITLPCKDAVSESSTVPYLTLSYVWGKSDENNPEILIDGGSFKVTPNLEKVLVHLRNEIDLPIWIDAISINQGDVAERNEQVKMMGDIYRYAVRTIIWLGEGNDSTGKLMTHLGKIGKDAIAAKLNDLTMEDMKQWPEFEPDSVEDHIRQGLEALFPKMSKGYEDGVPFPLNDLVEMSELVWFTRVWIIQELSMSSDYSFMCGRWIVPGDHFVAAFKFSILWVAKQFQLGALPDKQPSVNPRASFTLGTRSKWRRNRGTMTLKNLLVQSFILLSVEGLNATDPRDKIYALLGMACDVDELNISIDYKKSATDLFKEVGRKLIQSGNLDILSLCKASQSGEPRNAALPSWAPNWETRILPPLGGFLEDKLVYASGKDQPKRIKTTSSTPDNVLAITARFLGKVKEVGTTWTSGVGGEFDPEKAKTLFRQVAGFLLKTKIFNSPRIGEAIWQIPIGDKEMGALGVVQRATEKSYKEFQEIWAMLFKNERPFEYLTKSSYLACMKDTYNMKPFLSEDAFGGYVGLCPNGSEIGDEIFIPFGSHVPLVFRKAEDVFYKVVGELYVQGLMYGEALELNLDSQEVWLI